MLGVHSGHEPHVEHTDQTAESDCLAKIAPFCQPQVLDEILLPRCGELQTHAQRGNESISEEQFFDRDRSANEATTDYNRRAIHSPTPERLSTSRRPAEGDRPGAEKVPILQ
jgi:hypothetical protein